MNRASSTVAGCSSQAVATVEAHAVACASGRGCTAQSLLQLTFCISEHAGGCVEHLPVCCWEEVFETGSQALQTAAQSHQPTQDHSQA